MQIAVIIIVSSFMRISGCFFNLFFSVFLSLLLLFFLNKLSFFISLSSPFEKSVPLIFKNRTTIRAFTKKRKKRTIIRAIGKEILFIILKKLLSVVIK